METVKLIVIILVSLFVFTGGILFLLWFFRDRFVPKVPESGRNPEEDPEEAAYAPYVSEPVRSSEALNSRPAYASAPAGPAYTPYQPDTGDYGYGDDEDYDDYPEENMDSEQDYDASSSAADSGPSAAHLSDLLDCIYLPGRRLSECGIPGDYISGDGTEVPVDGDLFGEYAYGGLTLSGDGSDDPTIDSFYIIGSGLSFSEYGERFRERFGESVSEGEQEGEDGSKTEYAGFSTDFGTLWLSKGSGNDYVNINFT